MNNLQTSYILLTHQNDTTPAWARAERYNYCESKSQSFLYRLFH